MKEGPDIARLGALIGDPARANMLTALMSGKALTATELATEAGITLQTTSSHLKKLQDGNLVVHTKQGRHRYFRLSDDSIGSLLESLMGVAIEKGYTRARTGPKDPALRKARVCYNHLAGDMGVQLLDSMKQHHLVKPDFEALVLTEEGEDFVADFGIPLRELRKQRRPLCRSCLDWSVRRNHLAGSIGTALLSKFYELGWARRLPDSRIVSFTPEGLRQFNQKFSTT